MTKEKEELKQLNKMIGLRVKTLRRLNGLTQAQLGEYLGGLTFQQIQKYEKGINRISGASLYKLSLIFKVHINDFYVWCGKEENEIDENRDLIKLIKYAKNVPPELLKSINRILKLL